jgi:hypothetical protein
VHDGHDGLGDRHFHVVPARELQHRVAGLHALGGLLGDGDDLFQAHAAAEVLTERAVARQRRAAGGDEVAHAREPGESVLVGAERGTEPGDLGEPAGHEQGAHVVAHAHADRDADGEGDDVLDRPAQLAADHVRVGVRTEVGGHAGELKLLRGRLVGAGHGGGRRLLQSDLAR